MNGRDGVETRWTMIREAADGDAVARSDFASAYLPIVRAYLRTRWRGGALVGAVDDAVQDVFLTCLGESSALRNLSEESAGRFRTWLFGVTRNIARRHEERGRGAIAREDPLDDQSARELKDREEALSLLFDRAWARAMTRRAAARMRSEAGTDEDRLREVELLRLRFEEGRPIREIATLWKIDATRVHKSYARARERFQSALRREIADHGGRTPAEVEAECRELLRRI